MASPRCCARSALCAGWRSTATWCRRRRWAGSGTHSGHTTKVASHKGQKLLNRVAVSSTTRMALLAVLGASVGPVDGRRNQMARCVDYHLGRQGGPRAQPDRPAQSDGAAAQRGGCGAIARPNAAGYLPRGPAGVRPQPLPPSEALGRIRDAFHNYDHQGRVLVHHGIGGALSVRPGRPCIPS
jgi:hypothetical protein